MNKLMQGCCLAFILALPTLSYAGSDEEFVITGTYKQNDYSHRDWGYYSVGVEFIGGDYGDGLGKSSIAVDIPVEEPEPDVVITAHRPLYLDDGYVAYYYQGVYAIYRDHWLNFIFGDQFKGYFVPSNEEEGTMKILEPETTVSIKWRGIEASIKNTPQSEQWWKQVPGSDLDQYPELQDNK